MSKQRVAIVAGARTPFAKAGKAFKGLGPLKLGTNAVKGLIERHDLEPVSVEALAFGRGTWSGSSWCSTMSAFGSSAP